jgi:type II secretory pathway pseudopilin PulG
VPIQNLVTARAGEESGFGLIELLMAIVMLNVGILAIVAAFNAGGVTLARASRISTAAALADKQMERYRGLAYSAIQFDTAEWSSATADSTYTADAVYQQNMLNPVAPKALVPTVSGGTCLIGGAIPAECDPSLTTNGADGRSYRVDTYLYYDTPTGGGQLKTIAVVVRDAGNLSKSLARVSSTFDRSTGQ